MDKQCQIVRLVLHTMFVLLVLLVIGETVLNVCLVRLLCLIVRLVVLDQFVQVVQEIT